MRYIIHKVHILSNSFPEVRYLFRHTLWVPACALIINIYTGRPILSLCIFYYLSIFLPVDVPGVMIKIKGRWSSGMTFHSRLKSILDLIKLTRPWVCTILHQVFKSKLFIEFHTLIMNTMLNYWLKNIFLFFLFCTNISLYIFCGSAAWFFTSKQERKWCKVLLEWSTIAFKSVSQFEFVVGTYL